jgi:hypothetical protein
LFVLPTVFGFAESASHSSFTEKSREEIITVELYPPIACARHRADGAVAISPTMSTRTFAVYTDSRADGEEGGVLRETLGLVAGV